MDADDLYRLPPEEFTAARDAAARQARSEGDKERGAALKALRKPTASAHLVNLLAHSEAELLEQLLALGPALADAQAQGQGDELRSLGAQRRELVDAVTARAVELGGRDVTPAVREEVAGTLEAALADPSSAEAVRSGRLVRPLSYIGFGDVDLSGAVAPVPTAPEREKKKQQDEPDRERVAAAEAAALEAAGRLDDAVRACEQAQREHQQAEEHASTAHAEVERRRAALQEAEREAREADSARTKAGKAADKAVAAVRRAQEREEQARGELDRLRRRS